MSIRERDRLRVLHELAKRHISQKEAAEQLGVSTRWVRTLQKRLRQQGDCALLHGLRGRASNRQLDGKVKEKAVAIVRRQQRARQWHDYGPTLAAEELAADYGLRVGKETLRKWLIEAGLWKPKRARAKNVHQWRARRERFGELVQWDTSAHDWLEGRGEKLYLIALIDDATSRVMARFVCHDSTEENLRLLRRYLETHGRPAAVYTDKASLFQTTEKRRRDQPGEEVDPRRMPPTQIGRALRELNIEWIAAHSPQAKGRVERFFGTAQNRLVKGLRKVRASSLEEANAYLEQVYLPMWNGRFAVPAAQPSDAHRPLGRLDLDSILSWVERRTVARDYTIRLHGATWRMRPGDGGAGLRGSCVAVERRLDGSHWVRLAQKTVPLIRCEAVAVASDDPRRLTPEKADRPDALRRLEEGRRKWQASWNRQPNRPLWQAIRDSNAGA